MKGKKTDEKDSIKVIIITEENPTEFIKKSQGKWTLNIIRLQIIWFISFENLTGKFGLKHQVIIILKELVKADGIKFQLAK